MIHLKGGMILPRVTTWNRSSKPVVGAWQRERASRNVGGMRIKPAIEGGRCSGKCLQVVEGNVRSERRRKHMKGLWALGQQDKSEKAKATELAGIWPVRSALVAA